MKKQSEKIKILGYKYNGFGIAGLSAQKTGEILNDLYLKNKGKIDADIVFNAAKNPKHPFHQHLYKDSDKVLAMKMRLQMARDIIRNFQIITEVNGEQIARKAYHNIVERTDGSLTTNLFESNKESYYVSNADVVSDGDLQHYVLERAKREMRWFKSKYNDLKELAEVIEAMNKVLEETVAQKQAA